jgi:DNA-binding winged helix-turn-helix (wHTH) protein
MRVSFGDFVLDLDRRQLVHKDQDAHLTPKALDLLAFLVAERPRAVAKTEIRDHLWPGTFVSESNLTTLVRELRAALGDTARSSRYVKTVHRFGYAFCGEVGGATDAIKGRSVRFRLFCQDREVTLEQGENLLGRTDEATVWIDAPTISRRHARIVVLAGQATLEDLGSRNGTWLRGKRIDSPCVLRDGDEIRLGRVPATFRVLRVGSTRIDSKV